MPVGPSLPATVTPIIAPAGMTIMMACSSGMAGKFALGGVCVASVPVRVEISGNTQRELTVGTSGHRIRGVH
jgi:hypothetical protein